MTHPESADTRWTPPPWLRRLRAVTEEVRHAPASSPAERLRLGFELIAFAEPPGGAGGAAWVRRT